MTSYDTVIGLEIHVALMTESKFLCSSDDLRGSAKQPMLSCLPRTARHLAPN